MSSDVQLRLIKLAFFIVCFNGTCVAPWFESGLIAVVRVLFSLCYSAILFPWLSFRWPSFIRRRNSSLCRLRRHIIATTTKCNNFLFAVWPHWIAFFVCVCVWTPFACDEMTAISWIPLLVFDSLEIPFLLSVARALHCGRRRVQQKRNFRSRFGYFYCEIHDSFGYLGCFISLSVELQLPSLHDVRFDATGITRADRKWITKKKKNQFVGVVCV